ATSRKTNSKKINATHYCEQKKFLPCSTQWGKSRNFTTSSLLPKSVVKTKHLSPKAKIWNFFDVTRKKEQKRYGQVENKSSKS
ncbi:MAG: hypothetical protein IIV19_05470, partial [Bacteroidaceae bacterium]|nr:hypothetical protein [Bacteroidaceae bacterium]